MKNYLFKYKGLFSLLILTTICASFADIGFSLLVKLMLDTAEFKDPTMFGQSLKFSIIFIIFYFIIKYLSEIFSSIYNKKIITLLRSDIFNAILNKKSNNSEQQNINLNISVFTNDIGMIEQDYINSILSIFSCIINLILALFIMIKTNFFISIIVISMSLLPIGVTLLFSKKVSETKLSYSNKIASFTTKIKEYFSGIEVIRSFNIEKLIHQEFNKSNITLEESKLKFKKISILSNTISGTISSSIFLLALSAGTYFVINNKLSIGDMILFVQLLNYVITPLNKIPQNLNNLKSVKQIEIKLFNIINSKNTETNRTVKKKSFESALIFENVNFGYNELLTLKNINLKIEKGKKYAIVGPSGCGKSSLLKLLLRQKLPSSGNIYLDNVNYLNISNIDFYDLLSTVHQEIFMFEETIKNNITLYKDYPIEKLNRILILSGIDNMVNSLKNGIETVINDSGGNFSGGEKQRISIARALIKETPILLLDEVTSSLDIKTAYEIENTLLNIDSLTCLVVTHRLDPSILKKYDEILVMKDGEIIEIGSYDTLIENKDYFYSLSKVNNLNILNSSLS